MTERTKKLCYVALFTALICILTLFTHIPVPAANGRYIHLGDAAIFMAGILIGPAGGAFAAGVGSSLADLFSGASLWAAPTLVIKFIMGLVMGLMANHYKYVCKRNIFAMILSGCIMTAGYFLSEVCFFGLSPWAELLTTHFYFIQFGSGIVVAVVVLPVLAKLHISFPFYKNTKGENNVGSNI